MFCDRYVKKFSHPLNQARSIGIEKEILSTDKDGFMANISQTIWPHFEKMGLKAVTDNYYTDSVIGYSLGGDQIALDAGKGTFEIIMRPFETVVGAESRMKEILSVLLDICDTEGVKLLGIGYQPRTQPARENWNRKQRYEVLLDYFKEPVYPAGLSASDQVHIDVSLEEYVQVVNVMNGLAGFMVALFGNCPVVEDQPSEWKAMRELIWDDLGKDRTGVPEYPISSIEDYLWRTWEMTCFMAKEGEKFYSPGMPFKDFVAAMSDDDVFDAYNIHEGTVWFCARPRVYGTIEVRPAGLQPWNDMVTVPAFMMGVMENLDEIETFIKDFRWDTLRELRIQTASKGFEVDFEGKPLDQFLHQLLELIEKGLKSRGKGEEKYLGALFDRVINKKSPADYNLEYFKKGGMPMLLDEVSLKREHLK